MTASMPKRLGRGLVAGVLAGLAFTFVSLLLRFVAGVPLVADLVGDRVIPTLDVLTFVRLMGRVGGPLRGKSLGFTLSLLAQVGVGAATGAAFALLSGGGDLGRRRRRAARILAASAAAVWLAGVILLWPVVASNYSGLPAPWARLTTVLALAVETGAFVWVLLGVDRSVARIPERPRTAPTISEAPTRRVRSRTIPTVGRRAVLVGGAGVVMAAASAALADGLYRRATFGAFGYDGLALRGPHTAPITPNVDFYCVTKDLIDPVDE